MNELIYIYIYDIIIYIYIYLEINVYSGTKSAKKTVGNRRLGNLLR